MIAIEGEEAEASRVALKKAKAAFEVLREQIAPLKAQRDQLSRQFWVDKDQVVGNKYDLSASRYLMLGQDETFYEEPKVTLDRMAVLESVIADEIGDLNELLG